MEASSNALADARADEPAQTEPDSRSPVRFRVTSEPVIWHKRNSRTIPEINFDNAEWDEPELPDFQIDNITSHNANSDDIGRGSLVSMASTGPANTHDGGVAREGSIEEGLANLAMEEAQSTEEVKESIGMSQRIKMKIKTRYLKIKNKMRDKKDDWSEIVDWHTDELRWKYRDYKKKKEQKKNPEPERDPNVPPTASPTDMARYEHHMRFARREMRRCARNPNWKGVQDPQKQTGHTDISDQPWCPGRGNYDVFRDLRKPNPLRSHPAWLPAEAPPLQEWNKDEFLIPNPARRELEEWHEGHEEEWNRGLKKRLKQENERNKLLTMAETVDKLMNNERIRPEDLYDEEEYRLGEADEDSFTRPKRQSTGLTPSKTMPFDFDYGPSREPSPEKLDSSDEDVYGRARTGSVDVVIPRMSDTAQKKKNRKAVVVPTGVYNYEGRGVTQQGSDGNLQLSRSFVKNQMTIQRKERASLQAQAQVQATPSGTSQAAPSSSFGAYLQTPTQTYGYSQRQVQARSPGEYAIPLENLRPRQTYSSSDAQAGPSGTYGTHSDTAPQSSGRSQGQARPTGIYQGGQSSAYGASPRQGFAPQSDESSQAQAERYGAYQGGPSSACRSPLASAGQASVHQRCGYDQAEARPSGTYQAAPTRTCGTPLVSPRQVSASQAYGSSQAQAGPSGMYQTTPPHAFRSPRPKPSQKSARQRIGYDQRLASPSRSHGARQTPRPAAPSPTHVAHKAVPARTQYLHTPCQGYGDSSNSARPTSQTAYHTARPPRGSSMAPSSGVVEAESNQSNPSASNDGSRDRHALPPTDNGAIDYSMVDNDGHTINDSFLDDTEPLPSSPPTIVRRGGHGSDGIQAESPTLPPMPRLPDVNDYRSSASFSAAAVQTPTRRRRDDDDDEETGIDERIFYTARGESRGGEGGN